MSRLNLNHLAIFDAVATEKNVSRGAQKLMISQPAVSKQLGQLERCLGVALVERLPRGVRLTQEGELLARYARQIFSLREEAELALTDVRRLERGSLRIGASTTIAIYLLPELIVRFKEKYPRLAVQLEVARSADVQCRLLDGTIDLGFAELFDGDEALDAAVVYQDELVAIARPQHPLARKDKPTLQQLVREPFVVRDTGSDTKSFVERILAQKGVRLVPVMSLGSTEAIKRAVAAGIGIAIVSRRSIELELRARRLSVLPVAGLSIKRPFYRLFRAGRPPSPAAQAFLGLLE